MSFIADKQTLDDLNLLGKYKSNSVYSLFNKVCTEGGEKLLDTMFRHPLTDVAAINRRSKIFSYFQRQLFPFPFSVEEFSVMENYLSSGGSGNSFTASMDLLRKNFLQGIGLDKDYDTIKAGLYGTIKMLNKLIDFLPQLSDKENRNPFNEEIDVIRNILSNSRLHWITQEKNNRQLSLPQIIRYDTLLRLSLREEMTTVLQFIYQVDVYIAVARVARARGFCNAVALPRESYCMRISDCRHPGIEKAVANSVSLQMNSNVLFLTGANMAGKSTFMKSFSISVYLAHMGFPVPASAMEFSVLDGLYTSINVPDSLQLGYSHFYAEVRRVKTVAENVSAGKNLLVIFDELFKGTNVKDAYDATLAVTQAFSEYRNCFFIISTHIIEAADVLKANCNNLQLVYFPTVMEGSVPRYTYQLQQGVSADRHGMMIIQNEGIIEIIKKKGTQQVPLALP
jgi:DNA mismatch repair protein MutS